MFPGFQQFPEGQIIGFALIFLRLMAFVVSWPVFGTQSVPTPVKVLLALALSIVIFPTVGFQNINLIKMDDEIFFLAIREVFIGLALGFMMRMFFFAVSMAGEIVGVASGLASAQLFNPAMGSQSNVLDQFHVMIATLLFLALNGHHIFIEGVAKSFELVPVAATAIKSNGFSSMSLAIQEIFLMGVKIGAPVMISVLITNIAMGIVGRAVPQMNVLMTAMQVTILIGIGVIIIALPIYLEEMKVLLNSMAGQFFTMMRVL